MTRKKYYLTGFVASSLIACGGYAHIKDQPSIAYEVKNNTAQTATVEYASAVDTTKTSAINDTKFKDSIDALIAQNSNLDIGVALVDLGSGINYQYGETGAYTAASVTKVITAAFYLSTVEDGEYTLQTTVGQDTAANQLEQLIVNSDNEAWQNFYALLGKANQESYAQKLGLSSYNATANQIDTADMAAFLAKLYSGELLNSEHTKLLLSYMNNASQTDYLYDTLASYGTVYHKAGWLSDRMHDVAIVETDTSAYALVVFTKTSGEYPVIQAQKLFNSIAELSAQTFISKT